MTETPPKRKSPPQLPEPETASESAATDVEEPPRRKTPPKPPEPRSPKLSRDEGSNQTPARPPDRKSPRSSRDEGTNQTQPPPTKQKRESVQSGAPESLPATDTEEPPPRRKTPPNPPERKSPRSSRDGGTNQTQPPPTKPKRESVQPAPDPESTPATDAEEPPPRRKTPPKPPEQKSPRSSKAGDNWHYKHPAREPPGPPIERPVEHQRPKEHHHRKPSSAGSAGRRRRSKGSSGSSDAVSEAEEQPPPPPPKPRKLSAEKKPLPQKAPEEKPRKLSEDGEPLPEKVHKHRKHRDRPPSIIEQDGKEIRRPVDQKGKPTPVYVTAEGKIILDEQGNAIPLKFDEQGRPMPLEMKGPPVSYQTGQQEKPQQPFFDPAWVGYSYQEERQEEPQEPSIVPVWLSIGGIMNAVVCIGIACFVAYVYHKGVKEREGLIIEEDVEALISSFWLIVLESLLGLANFATSAYAMIAFWACASFLLFLAQGCILYVKDATGSDPIVVCAVYSGLVFLYVLIGAFGRYCCIEVDYPPPPGTMAEEIMLRRQRRRQVQPQIPSNYVDPRSIPANVNQQAPVMQQQVPVQPAPVMANTGYAYGAYGAYQPNAGYGPGQGMGPGYSNPPYYDNRWV